eukprot:750566-Hanusia_phi.AAC.2
MRRSQGDPHVPRPPASFRARKRVLSPADAIPPTCTPVVSRLVDGRVPTPRDMQPLLEPTQTLLNPDTPPLRTPDQHHHP